MGKEPERKPRRKFIRSGSGELLDTQGLALKLNESPFTVRDWRRKGIVPYLRLGHRTIRYFYPDVIRALERFAIKAK
jgi:hypothetical protein